MKRIIAIVMSVLMTSVLMVPANARGESAEEKPKDLWSAVKPLDTIVSFLNTGAHPDDERSDLLAYLSRGKGVRTASLIANRGEGGQNEIGNELGDALGIIRTRELIEASKVTGVKVYHLSRKPSDEIYDFGFSKSKEETLSKWGEQTAYERVIRLIRTYRPDIIMPSFLDVDTEHGHHRTMNYLTLKAYKDAADPKVFPGQIKEGLKPWGIKKLYLPSDEKGATTSFQIGMMDDVYGKTYPQIGEESRFLHKSQGMGRDIPAQPRMIHLKLENSRLGAPGTEQSLFDHLPYDLKEYAGTVKDKGVKKKLKDLQSDYDDLVELYPDRKAIAEDVYPAIKHTRQLEERVKRSSLSREAKDDLLFRLDIKESQLMNLAAEASQVTVKTVIDHPVLVQGGSAKVKVTVKNNGKQILRSVKAALHLPKTWKVSEHLHRAELKPGEAKTFAFSIKAAKNASYYQPYEPSVITSSVTYKVHGTKAEKSVELEQTAAVLPDVSVKSDPESLVVNTADLKKSIQVKVEAKNHTAGKEQAVLHLKVPDGWKVANDGQKVSFNKHGEVKTAVFTVQLPAQVKEGSYRLKPDATVNGKTLGTSVQNISYPHIGNFYYLYDAGTKAAAFPLQFDKSKRIGYVESGFDNVSSQLRAVGMNVVSLDKGQLEAMDLSQFDTIVIGIRAYLSREDLLKNNSRLLDFVKNGGHLVVQYHKPEDKWDAEKTAPYKLVIGSPSIRWRVTDENAKVTMLKPAHPLFNTPNKITDKDWQGWIQERGLYYPSEWSDQFETFVSMADPNEAPFNGGILMANYGKGSYLYTNLVWYRQIQNNVPGGYRLFTNLIDYSREQ
ncbi:NEW3 domain-containing protein [Fictibacillus terranigra]|uniref:NEW3 domain-containing protein n=1 Tax=Fictibacillus terranigra TaxID=3058424 RepID=A0ABT8E186_9BACL|nr:NEW3 domain-containing protein [Fictibacillus sp. CENA-BCM004]MDN4071670.1 NEW3 domain-containing protein [Fictibacillus sp. CENA-BCM004]